MRIGMTSIKCHGKVVKVYAVFVINYTREVIKERGYLIRLLSWTFPVPGILEFLLGSIFPPKIKAVL